MRSRGGRRALGAALTLLVGLLPLAACSSDDADDVTLVEGRVEKVDAIDNTFRPESIEVPAGTEVEWTNLGRSSHDVLPVDGDDWGAPAGSFEPDDVYRHRFLEPGTYAYYCSLHGTTTQGMVGTVVVTT